MSRKCTDRKYCIQDDYGYSNWTVEGTSVDCLLHLNDKFPVDRFYGEVPELLFAKDCPRFIAGNSVEVDVDQEDGDLENYSDDPEIKALLKSYQRY